LVGYGDRIDGRRTDPCHEEQQDPETPCLSFRDLAYWWYCDPTLGDCKRYGGVGSATDWCCGFENGQNPGFDPTPGEITPEYEQWQADIAQQCQNDPWQYDLDKCFDIRRLALNRNYYIEAGLPLSEYRSLDHICTEGELHYGNYICYPRRRAGFAFAGGMFVCGRQLSTSKSHVLHFHIGSFLCSGEPHFKVRRCTLQRARLWTLSHTFIVFML
jgi:hypothetical protein